METQPPKDNSMAKTNGSNPQDAVALALTEAAAVMAGNKVKAWVQVNISSDQYKRHVAEMGVSETRDIPEGVDPAVVRDQLIDEVRATVYGAATEMLAQLRNLIVDEAEMVAAITTNTPYVPPKPAQTAAKPTVPVTGTIGGVAQPPAPAAAHVPQKLAKPPKAENRKPGDWWEVDCSEYRLTADKLELIKAGSQYAEAILSPKSPCWPETWIPTMKNDGSHQQLGVTVRVKCVVSDNKNGKGNHFVNVAELTVLE